MFCSIGPCRVPIVYSCALSAANTTTIPVCALYNNACHMKYAIVNFVVGITTTRKLEFDTLVCSIVSCGDWVELSAPAKLKN